MKPLLAAVLLLGAASRARAIELGAHQTAGSLDYSGTDAWVEFPLGGDFTLRPEYTQSSSSMSGGVNKTYQARLAYDNSAYGFGLSGGQTPVLDGYQNYFYGGDFRFSVQQDVGGQDAPRVDVGAGVQFTKHSDDLTATRARRADRFDTTETDLSLNFGLHLGWLGMSGTWTTSTYDKNVLASDRQALRLRLPNVDGSLQGFPDRTVAIRFDFPRCPVTSPFVTYTRTSYKANTSTTNIYGAGFTQELSGVEFYGKVEYTHPVDAQAPLDQDTTNFIYGASVRFGPGS